MSCKGGTKTTPTQCQGHPSHQNLLGHQGHRPNTVCFVIQEEKEESSSGGEQAGCTSGAANFVQTIQCDVTLKVNETIKMVSSPLLVTSPQTAETGGQSEDVEVEIDNKNEELEEDVEEDSGTESVPEVKETILWEEKVTFANLPSLKQPITE